MFGLTSKQRNATKMVCYSELTSPDTAPDFRFVFVWWGNDFCHEIMNLIYWKELVKVQKLLNVLLKIQIHFINIRHTK